MSNLIPSSPADPATKVNITAQLEGLNLDLDVASLLCQIPAPTFDFTPPLEELKFDLDVHSLLGQIPAPTFDFTPPLEGLKLVPDVHSLLGQIPAPTFDFTPPLEESELTAQIPIEPNGMSPLDDELWAGLSTLGIDFQEMYEGAWEAFLSAGADAHRQSAHSARELIDWTLRTLAPDSVFSPEKIRAFGHSGHPTRRMRARYILGGRSRASDFVEAMAKAVDENYASLAAVAHTGQSSQTRLRGLIRGCEAVLLVLLGKREELSST